jgi:hypothetical protein
MVRFEARVTDLVTHREKSLPANDIDVCEQFSNPESASRKSVGSTIPRSEFDYYSSISAPKQCDVA